MKLEVIIAPLVVFVAMSVLLVAARFYDHLPLKPPECSFKRVTGIPCVACRGTRSFRALAEGKVGLALKYNPLAVVACVIAAIWMGGYVWRKGQPPSRNYLSVRGVAILTAALLIGNWIYLILTEAWFPDL
ncbi:MAG: DUF2752 domain-containing protein [Verrucomicrobiales bacterium]|nr:DUF2752 domain-containing protein [Verrucomicrobiales bacterium]